MYVCMYVCISYITLRVGYHCYYTIPMLRQSVNNNDILRV